MYKLSLLRLCLALSLFLTFSAAQAAPLGPAELKNLLAQIREKRAAAPQMQADFQEEKSIKMMSKPVVSSGKVWFQTPNKFRREVKGNTPSLTVSDGSTLWIHYPKFQAAERYSLGKRSPLDAGITAITASLNLQGVEENYQITGATEAGGHVLQLSPRTPSLKRMLQRFTIHLNEALQVDRTEMLQPNGDKVVTAYSNESRGAIDPAMFQFSPPAGTNITTPLGGPK